VACGTVRIAGSELDEHVVLSADEQTYTLAGSLADELRGWPGPVCVTYDRGDGRYLGGPNAIRVVSYRLQGDGQHAPIVGRLERERSGFVLHTDDGKRFFVRGDAAALRAVVGRHIWMVATWQDGALRPARVGLLGQQPG
jgi:hypothetical protein